jgi:hypothetical protein
MKEGDAFAVGTPSWDIINELDAGATAAVEGSSEVVDGEADVMDTGATLGDELADGTVGAFCLEQLHERVAGTESGDASTVGIVELFAGQVEQVAVEWQDAIEYVDGDADVRDPGTTSGTGSGLLHARCSKRRRGGAQNL